VVVQVLLAPAIWPVLAASTGETRRTAKLLCLDLCAVSSQTRVVIEHAPGDGVLIRAHAKKAAERHHRLGHTSAELIDHHPFNGADALAAGVVDGSAFHPVALDQGLA
jgi:hypothetical protein